MADGADFVLPQMIVGLASATSGLATETLEELDDFD